MVGKRRECAGSPGRCVARGWAFLPELRMVARGLLWRREPIGAEVLVLLVVPSPLQVSCRVESCPGMVMDLAVEGGLRSEEKSVRMCRAGIGARPIPRGALTVPRDPPAPRGRAGSPPGYTTACHLLPPLKPGSSLIHNTSGLQSWHFTNC